MGREINSLMNEIYNNLEKYVDTGAPFEYKRPQYGIYLEDDLYDIVEKVCYLSIRNNPGFSISFAEINGQQYLFSESRFEIVFPGLVVEDDVLICMAIALVAIAKGNLRIRRELKKIEVIDQALCSFDLHYTQFHMPSQTQPCNCLKYTWR